MRPELVIEGNVFYEGRLVKSCIGIEEGRIRAVKKVLRGERHLDFGDKLVLPGAVDPHVHFREPGQTHKEDFSTGSLSAAHGGVTAVLDMPNNKPPITTARRLEDKYRTIRRRSHVDYGLFCGLGKDTKIGQAAALASAFKIYLGQTTGAMMVRDEDLLVEALAEMSEAGLQVTVHCEDPLRSVAGDTFEEKETARSLMEHDRARPEAMERDTVAHLASLSRTGDLNIAHMSSPTTLEVLPDNFTCEVTPHHISLDRKAPIGARGKMNPPLRSRNTARALWAALLDGRIDMVASDHAPHTEEEKSVPFAEAPAGVPGVETMLPLLLYGLRREVIPLPRLVQVVSSKAAEVFGLDRKGNIGVGMDADILIIDLRQVDRIRGRKLHSKCGWTPFEGMEAVFPRNVFLRGERIVEDHEFVGERGLGRPVREGVPGRERRDG